MTPAEELGQVARARIPLAALALLAPLRASGGIRVALEGEHALVDWDAGGREVLEHVLPIAGVELFLLQESKWHRLGSRLPAVPAPELREPRPLSSVVVPEAFVAATCDRLPAVRARLTLARDDRPRATTALRCGLAELARWAEDATTHDLARVRAARAGDVVVVVGEKLPLLAGERFWGDRVLCLLGFRAEPDLPEAALADALGLLADEIGLVDERAAVEAISRRAFAPLTRAAVRVAREGLA